MFIADYFPDSRHAKRHMGFLTFLGGLQERRSWTYQLVLPWSRSDWLLLPQPALPLLQVITLTNKQTNKLTNMHLYSICFSRKVVMQCDGSFENICCLKISLVSTRILEMRCSVVI